MDKENDVYDDKNNNDKEDVFQICVTVRQHTFNVERGGTYPSLYHYCHSSYFSLTSCSQNSYFHLPSSNIFFPFLSGGIQWYIHFDLLLSITSFQSHNFIISIIVSSKFLLSLTLLFMCSLLSSGVFSSYVFITSVKSLCKPFIIRHIHPYHSACY